MKIILKYTLIFSLISSFISSCANKEDMLLPNSGKNEGFRLVTASVENFSRHNVMTKATDAEESQVNNLAMLVYATPQNGTGKVLIADPVYVEGAKLDFVINTTNNAEGQYIANIQGDQRNSFRGFNGDLTTSRIYIVANINHLLEDADISTEDAFLSIGDHILTTVPQAGAQYSAIDIPEHNNKKGFPMIGYADADLSPDSTLGGGSEEALNISIKKLFAKINLKFVVQLDSENIPGGMGMVKTPYFEPDEWSVHNIPINYTLRDSAAANKPVNTVFSTEKFKIFNFSTETSKVNKRIENSPSGAEYFDFSFYMPEYKVLPVRNRSDLLQSQPNIESNLMQCHKPTFCDSYQKPTYVMIKGKFSDHQGHISEVQYSLYLGQNEIDDFQILRNQELNNTAIIKGLTNYIHEGDNNISIDHRVDVTSSGYSIAMERETLLDSHYEFRPMDISVQEGAVVVVKLPQNNWFGAELHNPNNNSGVYDSAKPGLRKYFTTSLLNELGSTTAPKEFVFRATDDGDDVQDEVKFRLWFYFDENSSSPYDASQPNSATNKLYREEKILVDHYENENAYSQHSPKTADREFTFRQMNLWSIQADINDYYIEYFEEYLYNYASDDNYGVTTDGMEWGLSDLDYNLSTKRQAIYVNQEDMGGFGEFLISLIGGSFQDFFNTAFSQIKEKYDFYLSRDKVSKPRDYAGIDFTKEIVTQAGIDNNTLTLSGVADSAIEYCYNKNKRNENGKVGTIHWYLPAIDETEEILVDGFEYFQVFQSKYYWSSQPSFHRNNFRATYTGLFGVTTNASGAYYSEDTERARATIVTETTTSAESGVDGEMQTVPITINGSNSVTFGTATKGTETPHAGNKLRTDTHRVRCAYSTDGFPHIFGDYNVSVSTTQNGTGSNITVTISKSNDLTKGNVMLSNYLHNVFNDIGYPQYATYNKETKILTINMGQQVGIEHEFWGSTIKHNSVLYDGNTRVENQPPITLQYNSETHSFSVIGNTLNLRTDEDNSANYIQSFTRATN